MKNSNNKETAKNSNRQAMEYTDDYGNTYTEAAGTYHYAMTDAVAKDMFRRTFSQPGMPESTKETLRECSDSMQALNLSLARRLDDFKARRELIEYDYDLAKTTIQKLAACEAQEKSLVAAALRRILIMDNWAFVAEQRVAIRESLFRGSIREYDSDGNLVDGLSDDEEQQLQELCKTRSSMLTLLLQTDVLSDLHQTILDTLEAMDITTQAVLDGTLDSILDAVKTIPA